MVVASVEDVLVLVSVDDVVELVVLGVVDDDIELLLVLGVVLEKVESVVDTLELGVVELGLVTVAP